MRLHAQAQRHEGYSNLEPPPQTRLDWMLGPSSSRTSSGADFVDFIYMSPHEAKSRQQDAATYRSLCGGDAEVLRRGGHPAAASRLNIKRLAGYRDNVTRNLAPTIVLGFVLSRKAGRMSRSVSHPESPGLRHTETPRQESQPSISTGGFVATVRGDHAPHGSHHPASSDPSSDGRVRGSAEGAAEAKQPVAAAE